MEKELRLLLDKYMDGMTTLEEEAWLAEYFRTNEVGEEFLPFKEMLEVIEEDIRNLSPVLSEGEDGLDTPVVGKRPFAVLRIVSWVASVAAVALLVFVLSRKQEDAQTQVAQVKQPEAIESIEIRQEEGTGSLQNLREENKKSNVHKVTQVKQIAQATAETVEIEVAEEEHLREKKPCSGHDENLMADASIMMEMQLQMIDLQRLNNYYDEDEDTYFIAEF